MDKNKNLQLAHTIIIYENIVFHGYNPYSTIAQCYLRTTFISNAMLAAKRELKPRPPTRGASLTAKKPSTQPSIPKTKNQRRKEEKQISPSFELKRWHQRPDIE